MDAVTELIYADFVRSGFVSTTILDDLLADHGPLSPRGASMDVTDEHGVSVARLRYDRTNNPADVEIQFGGLDLTVSVKTLRSDLKTGKPEHRIALTRLFDRHDAEPRDQPALDVKVLRLFRFARFNGIHVDVARAESLVDSMLAMGAVPNDGRIRNVTPGFVSSPSGETAVRWYLTDTHVVEEALSDQNPTTLTMFALGGKVNIDKAHVTIADGASVHTIRVGTQGDDPAMSNRGDELMATTLARLLRQSEHQP